MKKLTILLIVAAMAIPAMASSVGWIDTERFGYNGTITRYSDSTLETQVDDVIDTGSRDGSFWSDSESPASVIMGSWWYSTETDDQGAPLGAGWGNTTGNTGPGFIQFYDLAQDFVTDQSYSFSNFDGTYWTDFSFELNVAMTEAGAYSRLSAPDNTGDSGYFQSLNVNLTATGLQGIEQTNGTIIAEESDTFAADVTGSISGIFVNTSTEEVDNNGYYVFDFDINMVNWAYENRDSLVGDYSEFYEGSFGVVPEPATIAILGIGAVGLIRRKRCA